VIKELRHYCLHSQVQLLADDSCLLIWIRCSSILSVVNLFSAIISWSSSVFGLRCVYYYLMDDSGCI